MNISLNNLHIRRYSPVILRIGIALIFLWFGTSQFTDPNSYLAFVPQSVVSLSGLSTLTLVHINGILEMVLGTFLLFGFLTRWVALLLALHILDITYIVGFDAIGVRDFGLSIATIAIFFNGMDWFSLDEFIREKEIEHEEKKELLKEIGL